MNNTFFNNIPKFKHREEEVIRRVCEIEIDSLENGIIGEKIEIQVYENLNDLPPDSVISETYKLLYVFYHLRDNPKALLTLDEKHLSLFKHILFTMIPEHNYQLEIKQLRRKFNTLTRTEDFLEKNLISQN